MPLLLILKINDISKLIKTTKIQVIFTTGSKASSIYDKYVKDISIKHISLPSTSSANARMKLDDLIEEYKVIKGFTNEED